MKDPINLTHLPNEYLEFCVKLGNTPLCRAIQIDHDFCLDPENGKTLKRHGIAGDYILDYGHRKEIVRKEDFERTYAFCERDIDGNLIVPLGILTGDSHG